MMSTIDLEQLEKEKARLKELVEAEEGKLKILDKQQANPLDPTRTPYWKMRIEEVEATRDGFLSRLRDVEKRIDQRKRELGQVNLPVNPPTTDLKMKNQQELLYTLLGSLNYFDQVRVFNSRIFREDLREPQVLAFVIHGKERYGQRWLLHRLVKLAREDSKGNPGLLSPMLVYKFSFKYDVLGKNTASHWRRLGSLVGREYLLQSVDEKAKQDITARVCELLEKQSITLLFEDVVDLNNPSVYLHDFIREFWEPLVKKLVGISLKHYLFLFLVEKQGRCTDDKPPLGDIDGICECSVPVPLKKLNKFPRRVLEPWLQGWVSEWPKLCEPTQYATQLAIETIIQETKGVPEEVLEYICRVCRQDWESNQRDWVGKYLEFQPEKGERHEF